MPVIKVTTSNDAIENMQEAFNTFWSSQPHQPKIAYDDVNFDAARIDLAVTSLGVESYVLLQIIHATGDIAALGTNLHRQEGIIQAVVYVNSNTGRKRAAGLVADQALEFFQTTHISGVTLTSPRMNEIGVSGKWWQVNVLANFTYDINRS